MIVLGFQSKVAVNAALRHKTPDFLQSQLQGQTLLGTYHQAVHL